MAKRNTKRSNTVVTERQRDNDTGRFLPKARASLSGRSRPSPSTRASRDNPGPQLPPNMREELRACARGEPSEDRVGAALRMHLKMRGLLKDASTGKLTPQGVKVAKAVDSSGNVNWDRRDARARWDEAMQKMRDSVTGQFVKA